MAKKAILSKSQIKERAEQSPKTPPQRTFNAEINHFVREIESLSKANEMTMNTIKAAFRKETDRLQNFINKKGIKITESETVSYEIKPEDFATFKQYHKDVTSCIFAIRNVPSSFLCTLVHHYDAYLGRLLRVIFFVKPELLNTSQKQMTYTDLISFPSIEAAREHVIEKEIESVIRDSHVGHFEWMENRFKLNLRADLAIWPKFVEITERRNLFVHCDSVISSQYMAMCKKHDVKLDKHIKVGEELIVDPDYFEQAVDCILEIGVKLGHVLWRKMQPDRLHDADKALHHATFDFLVEERYKLTKTLLNFSILTLKKQSSEEIRCMNLINLAIAQSFSGEQPKALSTLKGYDWSASADHFKLAVAVLEKRHGDAVYLMKRMGVHGFISRENYSSWPLFKEFRNTKDFVTAYKELFGEEFIFPKFEDQDEKKQLTASSRMAC